MGVLVVEDKEVAIPIEDSVVLEERDRVRVDIVMAVTLQHKVVEMLIEDSVVLDVREKENVVAEAEPNKKCDL